MTILRVFTDGASRGNPGEAAAGVAVFDSAGKIVLQNHHYLGQHTNNEAEYLAVIHSLSLLSSLEMREFLSKEGIEKIEWYLDSKLVVEQLMRRWKIKEARLSALAQKIWQNLDELGLNYSFHHVPRGQNQLADSLANQALDSR